jgi:hypothetical protein
LVLGGPGAPGGRGGVAPPPPTPGFPGGVPDIKRVGGTNFSWSARRSQKPRHPLSRDPLSRDPGFRLFWTHGDPSRQFRSNTRAPWLDLPPVSAIERPLGRHLRLRAGLGVPGRRGADAPACPLGLRLSYVTATAHRHLHRGGEQCLGPPSSRSRGSGGRAEGLTSLFFGTRRIQSAPTYCGRRRRRR